MSACCGLPLLECVYCLACARWAWKKFLYTAGSESENWGHAGAAEFEPVPRICRYILSVYEDDLRNPIWAPPGGYGMDPDWVILRRDYEETEGRVSPYMIYLDHQNDDIVLAIRGLNLGKESDFLVLLDNKLGQTKFDGGYVHNGLLKSAQRVLDAECEILRELIETNPSYTLTFAGHSLGAGVVTLLALLAVQNRGKLGNIERKRIRCFAIAPARCISLNLAVRYADVINSVVLQDDFLPRTTVALEDVFKSVFCLPCLLCLMCLKDTCTLEEKMLKDPRRLYAPGRLYHIIVRKPFRIGKIPPIVKTAVPVDGRFEHIVLSCNLTSDHAIIWIERESQRALDLMMEKERIMEIPPQQKMERQASLAREHSKEYKAALQKAIALDVPHAYSPSSYGTFQDIEEGDHSGRLHRESPLTSPKSRKETWDELVDRLFDTDESGRMVLKSQPT
ncbi:uncharacterized protein LOC127802586 isoform X1 [Diospyros lotus]|uniref:uncharacterized protein LOC127802586 isoform X1 n=1 Tax=Diospyros lotus TaxID=55363 RepID=UPI00225166C2|nr:uncharacterized protein LOC127802586 isoform X1 [Diospyros lotus]XP_052194436.1 uncharacterized protein LOC127802586 isoform X1 [Diospyros lotus]XP_052194437.1 uncharacterized protein LOC127802586 isoform X1 [Diospyros lotus]XP_052194438.1 uncharacterized protein LOC127802586 isoform X1 [Diospyros lotus]